MQSKLFRPRLFLGSSTEGRNIASLLIPVFEDCGVAVTPWWDPSVFPPGQSFLASVSNAVREFDAALFVATPDLFDHRKGRAKNWSANGNVILEYGMFLATHGDARSALALVGSTTLPSDLGGITQIVIRTARKRNSASLSIARDSEVRLSAWARSLFLDPPTHSSLFRCLSVDEGFNYVAARLRRVRHRFDHAAFSPPVPGWEIRANSYVDALREMLRENRVYYRYLAGIGNDPFRLGGVERQLNAFGLRPTAQGRRYTPRAILQLGKPTDISFHILDDSLLHVYVPGMDGSPGACLFSSAPDLIQKYRAHYDALWSHGLLLQNGRKIAAVRSMHARALRTLAMRL